MPKILVVEDDTTFSTMLLHFLKRHDYETALSSSVKEALEEINSQNFDVILSDLRLPDRDGLALLAILKEQNKLIPFVLMTAYADVKTAVKAMKSGAADYISKPFMPEEALLVLQKTLSSDKKVVPVAPIMETSEIKSGFYWGKGIASIKLKKHIDLVAPTPLSVLITGENGTGKEVAAKTIHEKSNRSSKAFVAVDCGAIPKDIAGSEFFGHIKGSFTGAINDKEGCFEAANNGTLFLDEIGNLSYENQILLLRAIQERKIKRIGSNQEIEIDIRLICATNENLKMAVANGSFREDLYHRINEFSISIPALRERKEDIEAFAYLFLEKACLQLNKEVSKITPEALVALCQYEWPGNIRELQNYIKRATLLSTNNTIDVDSLPDELVYPKNKAENLDLGLKDEAERKAIVDALAITNGNKTRAAEILGVSRKTMYNKITQYDL